MYNLSKLLSHLFMQVREAVADQATEWSSPSTVSMVYRSSVQDKRKDGGIASVSASRENTFFGQGSF